MIQINKEISKNFYFNKIVNLNFVWKKQIILIIDIKIFESFQIYKLYKLKTNKNMKKIKKKFKLNYNNKYRRQRN